MSCPVDAAKWAKENRVQLHRGQRNVWTLARTLDDGADLGRVEDDTRSLMVTLFDGWALDTAFADAGYAVDGIEVVHAGKLRPKAVPGEQRRTGLPGTVPLLKAGPSIFVTVAFNYRGFDHDMAWPVRGHALSWFEGEKSCPVQADWVLISSLPADKLQKAPPEPGSLDKLRAHGARTALGQLGELVTLAKWAAYLYAGSHIVRLVAPVAVSTAKRLRKAA